MKYELLDFLGTTEIEGMPAHCQGCGRRLYKVVLDEMEAPQGYCSLRCYSRKIAKVAEGAPERVRLFLQRQLDHGKDITKYLCSPWQPELTYRYTLRSPKYPPTQAVLETFRALLASKSTVQEN